MLTRLEVDGFKNLVGFEIDFGPFTCIAGPNGVGKSNVFDAIRFLSLLSDHTLVDAALRVRANGTDAEELRESADIRDLFQRGARHQGDSLRIAAEMIVDLPVRDDSGRSAVATATYLRYEIRLAFEAPSKRTLGKLVLQSEELTSIPKRQASSRLRFPSEKLFRDAVIQQESGSRVAFISSRRSSRGETKIIVHQDGVWGTAKMSSPAATAEKTIVATSNTVATPTILAARQEMQQWRLLALEPSLMRSPDRFHARPYITPNGAHLPATLYRLAQEAEEVGERPESVYASIATKLARLVSATAVRVDKDDLRQLLTVQVREPNGAWLPAASLSDGTLRFLTLAVLAADAEALGLICLEEPENGIHPAKMNEVVELLKEMAVDPAVKPGWANPLRQIIVATHSPAFVQLQNPNDLLFALRAAVRGEDGEPISTLRCRPLRDTWRAGEGGPSVDWATIVSYLSNPPEAQLALPPIAASA